MYADVSSGALSCAFFLDQMVLYPLSVITEGRAMRTKRELGSLGLFRAVWDS